MQFLFVDKILELVPGELTRGLKHVTWDDHYLSCDSDGQIHFPPSLIGETLGQLAAWNIMHTNDFTSRPVAGIVSRAVMSRPVLPGETLLLESVIDSIDSNSVSYQSSAFVDGDEVFRIDSALGPMLPMSEFINESDVRLQFNEIYRPGEYNPTEKSNHFLKDFSIASRRAVSTQFTFDHILDFQSKEQISACKNISRASPWFPDHFPKKPVLPMTVLLECQLNLANVFVQQSNLDKTYKPSELRRIKMNEFILPGDSVVCRLKVKQLDDQSLILSSRCEVNNKRVCVLEIVMTPSEKL